MTAAGWRGLGLLTALLYLALPGCQTTVVLPSGVDPNAPALAAIEFRWPQGGSLGLLPYGSYRLQWVGEWVSENSETTNAALVTYATQTITVQKDDILLSRVATLPVVDNLRGGRWSIALLLTGGPNDDPIGFWTCVLPSSQQPPTPDNQLPYLAPGLPTLVTFQGHGDGTVTCTAALTLLFFPTPTPSPYP